MTEAEWNSCTDPQRMLEFLRDNGRASDRKRRLFAVACCRRIWHLLIDKRSRRAVDLVERAAEGMVLPKRLASARTSAHRGADSARNNSTGSGAQWSAAMSVARATEGEFAFVAVNAANALASALDPTQRATYEVTKKGEVCFQSRLLRCIFVDPFRAAPAIERAALVWNDGTVKKLAQATYEELSLPEGTLDPQRLAVLADALEEAGCDAEDVLSHCRGPGRHVRGCWVLDALLGKD